MVLVLFGDQQTRGDIMLARVKFVTQMTKTQLATVQEFIGEEISYVRVRKETLTSLSSWDRDTPEEELHPSIVEPDRTKEYLVDATTLLTQFPYLEVTIKPVPSGLGSMNDLHAKIEALASKIQGVLSNFDKEIQFNQKCEVHVPNLGLLNINELAYANDYCTESLQDRLNEGWRLLSICPQPNQRRPDYILGRFVEGPHRLRVHNF